MIFTAFTSGLNYLATTERGQFSEVPKLIKSFIKKHKPSGTIDLYRIVRDKTIRLVDPAGIFPNPNVDQEELIKLACLARACKSQGSSKGSKLTKAYEWHRFLCGEVKSLPEDFFRREPYIHLGGGSYVMAALRSGKEIFNSEWFKNDRNLLLMHSYQEPKSPRESHPSARRREPQAGAGQANGPALLRFGWTISSKAYYGNPRSVFRRGWTLAQPRQW